MNLLKKLYKYFKGHEKWIEIKLPDYFKKKEDGFLKDDEEILDEEDSVLRNLELGKEEE